MADACTDTSFDYQLTEILLDGVPVATSPFTVNDATFTITGATASNPALGAIYTIKFVGELPNQQCADVTFTVTTVAAVCTTDTITAGTPLVNQNYFLTLGDTVLDQTGTFVQLEPTCPI